MSQVRKPPSVYVVDDEPTISLTLALILRKEGFVSKSFISPLEVLQAARVDAPDLLITDLAMPVMSGVQLAIEFKRNYPGSKVLLFSGNAQAAEFMREADGYSFDCLTKPVHPHELLRKVRTLLNGISAPAID